MDRDRIFVLALASVLLLLFFACENQQKRIYSSVLQSIDSLTYTSPKRALARLDSLDSCTDRQCVELSMWAKLLRLKARYKDYQSVDTNETPSIIRYYEDHGSVYQKMNAQYIAGAYWVEKGETPMAMKSFQTAEDCAKAINNKRDLLRIYCAKMDLYERIFVYEKALEEMKSAFDCAMSMGDTLMALTSMECKLRYYQQTDQIDSMASLSQRLYSAAQRINPCDYNALTLSYSVDACLRKREWKKAKRYLDMYETAFGCDSVGVSTLFGDLYDYKARYYMGVGKMDSALCFQRKLSQVAVTYYDKVKLYSNYQDLYDKLGNSDSLCKYSKLYCQYNDSTMANLNVERVAQIQSLYNYDRSLKEMYRQKKVKTLVILCGTVTVVLFLFVMLWQWRMGKKERRKIVSEIIAQREAYGNLLEAYRKKSKQLDLLMSGKDIRAEELLQESIGKLRKELVDNFAMKVFPKEWVCGSLLVRQLHSLAEEGKHPSDELWLQVEKELALNEENFMEWLTNCRKDKKLKEREWRMCLLVKMCFLPVEMAVLLVTSKQNVSNMRSRLVQKIFGQNGRSGEFDILISEL